MSTEVNNGEADGYFEILATAFSTLFDKSMVDERPNSESE